MTSAVATVLSIATPVTALTVSTDDYTQFGGSAQGQSVSVEAFEPTAGQPAPPPRSGTSRSIEGETDAVPSAGPPQSSVRVGGGNATNVRQWRATPELCQLSGLDGAAPVLRAECEGAGQRLAHNGIECDAGQEAQGALFEQRRSGDSWTVPEVVEEESCVDPALPAQDQPQQQQQRRQIDIPAAAARAFRNMTIEPSTLAVQPPDGWTLVNLDTIAYAEDEPRVLDTNLFGIPVSIRAVPDAYTWNWGDGTSDTGTDPGAPYPNHTVAHAYSSPGTATITLTTTWRGQFRLPGDQSWRDVPGRATTTSQSPPIEIREARTRLVEDLSH
ncbi:hypothetical protein [Myceligenerans pegani]|uniref:PKD domain-containing protein n=1 Tax=Myceligenerans pegani TaxID=2776917 RepID=A0ABR9N2P8_9MICO|nr:hypothetical protein [Myceligenerans sp. TRM 65318]MBE1877556.1 hypothetical protein [Myceligenerans sp. TRM 65318]MBE3019827.1 hypothetical protein [Myceligenerans sp. TRM 65318]